MVVKDIDIQRGETVPREFLFQLFETGGTWKGINLRRGPDGDRFVVLFGRDELYPEVASGFVDGDETRFKYVGEGLEGDQSLETSGNRALRDAIDSEIPIFFFLMEGDGDECTYYGKASVVGYEWVETGSRRVLTFDLEFESPPSSASLSSLMVISGSAV